MVVNYDSRSISATINIGIYQNDYPLDKRLKVLLDPESYFKDNLIWYYWRNSKNKDMYHQIRNFDIEYNYTLK